MTTENNKEPKFIRLFMAHESELRCFLRTLLPTWEAVDDVLQEASVVMWKKLDQLENEESFLPWAKVIARFEALHARRTAARDRLVLSEETVILLAAESLDLPLDLLRHERRALETCLRKLSEEHREIVLLPYRESGGVMQLAEQTKRSANSLYKLLGRLREKLRLCVERELSPKGNRP
jgi:RNA polymerase sigma-70 factor (ECF subfamily)